MSDVEYCVDMYISLAGNDIMPVSRQESLRLFINLARRKKFIKVLRKEPSSPIIAWLYADVVKLLHCDYLVFQQMYYASDQSGISAYKCIILLHDEMYEYAKETAARYCISNGSPIDESNVFARSLEKNGWKRKHFMAYRELPPGAQKQPRQDSSLGSLESVFSRP